MTDEAIAAEGQLIGIVQGKGVDAEGQQVILNEQLHFVVSGTVHDDETGKDVDVPNALEIHVMTRDPAAFGQFAGRIGEGGFAFTMTPPAPLIPMAPSETVEEAPDDQSPVH